MARKTERPPIPESNTPIIKDSIRVLEGRLELPSREAYASEAYVYTVPPLQQNATNTTDHPYWK